VREVYIAGSRHSANTPQLIRSEVNDDTSVDFEWQAVGSSIYRVTAKGMLTGSSIDAFKVVCSCPDGDRQRDASRISKKLYVCKHGKAALDSVIDTARRISQTKEVMPAKCTFICGRCEKEYDPQVSGDDHFMMNC